MFNKLAENKLSRGQALIELILAIAVGSIFLVAFITAAITAREAYARADKTLEADFLLQREIETLKAIKETAWNSFASPGTYHTEQIGTNWSAVAGSATTGIFSRSFTVQDVCRTSSISSIIDCNTPEAVVDPAVKKITATISWNFLGSRSISSTFYLSRYFANAVWNQTSETDFNSGTHSNTIATNNLGGEVELDRTNATSEYGNRFLLTSTSSIGNMTSASRATSLRFTAQTTKTVNAIRVFLNSEVGTSPTYRYGLQEDSAGQPSGNYLGSGTLQASGTGWKTINISPSVNITAGNIYHIVVQYQSGTINGSNYIALRRSAPLNGLYPFDNNPDAHANTLFNTGSGWAAQNFQPIYELDFTDNSYEGNPYESSSQISIFGNNFIGQKFQVTDSSKTATQISFYVRRNGTPTNNLLVTLLDADTDTIIEQGVLATPSIPASFAYHTYTFPAPINLLLNKNYRIYLSAPGTNNNNSYRVYRLNTTNAANFKTITFEGINSFYSTSNNSGGSWTDTNTHWDLGGFKFTIVTTTFANSGTFESQTFDAATQVSFNRLFFTAAKPVNTNLRLQIAVNNDGSTWNFVGPDGTSLTYFDTSQAIPINQSTARYFRFRAFLTSDGTNTPTLYDVSLNYSL